MPQEDPIEIPKLEEKAFEIAPLGDDQKNNWCSNIEPYRVLDIKNMGTKDRGNFKFVVIFISVMNQNTKKTYLLSHLDFLTARYRLWLLARFKKNLKDLSIIRNMKRWATEKLDILKDYCKSNSIEYEGLYLRSALPPTQVFVNTNIKQRKQSLKLEDENDTQNSNKLPDKPSKNKEQKKFVIPMLPSRSNEISGKRYSRIRETAGKFHQGCSSLKETYSPPTEQAECRVHHQTKFIKTLLNQVEKMRIKYESMANQEVSTDEFFSELNNINEYINKF